MTKRSSNEEAMKRDIGSDELKTMLGAVAQAIGANRERLNRLDAALGDGDHGASISAAFAQAVAAAADLPRPQPSEIWMTTARALMNSMGGASGALFGTLFLKGVGAIRGKARLCKSDFDELWTAGLAGVIARGKAEVGDKTMVDALQPAVLAFTAHDDLTRAWQAAAGAARLGAASTQSLVARRGRAKYLGERGIGHQDPGATSIALMFEALDSYWKDKTNGET